MAKIILEIDGQEALLKIDGKEVADLHDISASLWKCCNGMEIYFSYSTKNEVKKGDQFKTVTRFDYIPTNASISSGKIVADLKNPTKEDFKKI